MKSAIKMAWEHGGADFQSRFDKSTGQAQEMKKRERSEFYTVHQEANDDTEGLACEKSALA